MTRSDTGQQLDNCKTVDDVRIEGSCPEVIEALTAAKKAAPHQSTVIIRGESGTGKEVLACYTHRHSDRAKKPFIVVDCGAVHGNLLESELFGHEEGAFTDAKCQRIGKFEQANGGTIFLDEIGDMAPSLQGKLLRVLQKQEFERLGGNETIRVNVRVIAATHRNLEEMIKEGRFREDLYYRINVITITLPSLRDRGDDVIKLAEHFVEEFSKRLDKQFSPFNQAVRAALKEYSWPGNVRELKNVIERMVVMADGSEFSPDAVYKAINSPATKNSASSDAQVVPNTVGKSDSRPLHERPLEGDRLNAVAEALRSIVDENATRTDKDRLEAFRRAAMSVFGEPYDIERARKHFPLRKDVVDWVHASLNGDGSAEGFFASLPLDFREWLMKPTDGRRKNKLEELVARARGGMKYRESLAIGLWHDIFEDAASRLAGFFGTMHAFNVELNTLVSEKGTEFFAKMVEQFEGVHVAIPSHIFKRLEYSIAANPQLAARLGEKMRVYPISLRKDTNGMAFVYFRSAGGDRSKDFCYVLPKVQPFSRIVDEAESGPRYAYERYLLSTDAALNQELMGMVTHACRDLRPFGITEIERLAKGEREQIVDVLKRHFPADWREKANDFVVHDGSEFEVVMDETKRTLKYIKVRPEKPCEFKLHINASTDGARKPVLLWLPPWGVPAWHRLVRNMDEHLRKWYRLVHLEYAGDSTQSQTFSQAARDIQDALKVIEANSERLNVDPTKVVLVAVSLSAFVAAEVAAEAKQVAGLCLLAPAICLLDALDRFRAELNNIELFTRRVLVGQEEFLACDMDEAHLKFFGRPAGRTHLIDLCVRGRKRCVKDFFGENLDQLRDRSVFLGLSRLDEMTSYEEAASLCKGKGHVSFHEVSWRHAVKEGRAIFDPKVGVESAIAYLEELGNGFDAPDQPIGQPEHAPSAIA